MDLKEVYCINLLKSGDRKAHMDDFFRRVQFSAPLFRFEGVNGSRVINPRPKKHALGHVGCLLSHMCLWQLISTKNDGFYLILEDDIAIVPEDEGRNFENELNNTLNRLPRNIQMLHCTKDKSVKFKYTKSIFENTYKVIGTFNNRPIKKCSLVYPWATLSGAYLITPKAARKLFLFAYYSIKFSAFLPLKPKRYNIDILMSRSVIASIYGAMGIILLQNVPVKTSSTWASELKSISEGQGGNVKDIYVNRTFFKRADAFISPWQV